MLTGSMNMHEFQVVPSSMTSSLTLFVILKAFSSGCSAVTGIEAISDAVPHFRTPSVKNAKKTLASLGTLLAIVLEASPC